jgi:hypothetical protein
MQHLGSESRVNSSTLRLLVIDLVVIDAGSPAAEEAAKTLRDNLDGWFSTAK